MPDGRGTFTDLTVEENLRLGAYVRSDRSGVRDDFDRVFGYFPRLAERRRQQAGTLSGGEQQMLAISRALLMRPSLLMLDEPSFGLAPLVVAEIFRILAAINRDEGVSMLIVEQNASLALDLADQAVLIETGRVALSGPSQRDPRRRRRTARLSRLLIGELVERIPSPTGVRTGARRRLRDHGARAGDDLPGDPARELRPGRDGDVLDLFRLEADGLRAGPTGAPSS